MSSMFAFGIALLSMMHLVSANNVTDWNTGDGGFKWWTNCEFPGDDIGKFPLTTATRVECGRLCIANPQCIHFVVGDLYYCHMKKEPAPTTPRFDIDPERKAICGFIPWRYGYKTGTERGTEAHKKKWQNEFESKIIVKTHFVLFSRE
jgi:hypothetical protein